MCSHSFVAYIAICDWRKLNCRSTMPSVVFVFRKRQPCLSDVRDACSSYSYVSVERLDVWSMKIAIGTCASEHFSGKHTARKYRTLVSSYVFLVQPFG